VPTAFSQRFLSLSTNAPRPRFPSVPFVPGIPAAAGSAGQLHRQQHGSTNEPVSQHAFARRGLMHQLQHVEGL
jgi:hypothetical protein